jgi:DNA helicase-2/ATP-dependent DNA helicase PcrA
MKNRIIIPGPPGTGKTHHLVNFYLKKEIEEYKTPTNKIAYITFSNAATKEAQKRISISFPSHDIKKNFSYVTTMHAMGRREVGIDTTNKLLEGNKWKSFKNYSQICQHMAFGSKPDSETGYMVHENKHMKVIEYARNKKIDLSDASIELNLHHTLNLYTTEQINLDLDVFKKSTGMIEFSDMIKQFIEKDKCPPLDAIFLDEAQDLNPLQWDMFFYIESKCKRSYIAGDDDQTIYDFQGADPNIFINLKGEEDAKVISRRVPREVHKVAMSILSRIKKRREKTWVPRDADGAVYWNERLQDMDLSKGNWMILARTNHMLVPIKDNLVKRGLRFISKNNEHLPEKVLEAYRVWVRLNRGEVVTKEDAKTLYKEGLNCNLKHFVRNHANGKSIEKEFVSLKDLKQENGLLIEGDWKQLDFSDSIKHYMSSLLDNGDDLFSEARIKVSTIHGVKGEECDNVILYPCITHKIREKALKNPDAEYRVFFVGVTRTKENLYIMRSQNNLYYQIGEMIR